MPKTKMKSTSRIHKGNNYTTEVDKCLAIETGAFSTGHPLPKWKEN